MMHRQLSLLALLLLAIATPGFGLNGDKPLGVTTDNGWRSLELISQADDIAAIADAGYGVTLLQTKNDGLGLYRDGDALAVWVNHETTPAAVSRLEVDLAELQSAIDAVIAGQAGGGFAPVTSIGFAYDRVYDDAYHAVANPSPAAEGTLDVAAYAAANFSRFCSGTSHQPAAFGVGTGFVDSIYLTGEEVSGGYFYALDEATRTFWQASDLGRGAWENAAMVDTGETDHVALFLSSDVGSSPGDYLQMYVGRKGIDANEDGQIDFLERNGLRGGTVYYFVPDSGSTTDLPNGTVTGKWSTSTVGALLETKLEDVQTNPFDGSQLVLADQTDGVYRMQIDIAFALSGEFDPAASPVTIAQIDDDDVAPLGAPDNLTWSADGSIYAQEDGDGDEIYQMNPDGTGLERLAVAGSEPSGVIDASEALGYYAGSVLLTSLQGASGVPAQVGALIAPDAARILAGDFSGDGRVDNDDLNLLLGNWGEGANPRPAGWFGAPPAGDAIDNDELNALLGNWGAGISAAVPEPASWAIVACLLTPAATRRRQAQHAAGE